MAATILVALFAMTEMKNDPKIEKLLDAIERVETGGRNVWGDGGRSRGPMQISRAYWQDSKVQGSWQDVEKRAFARRVVVAYWQRYCPRALAERNLSVLSRVHNGGPRGASKRATLPYAAKVMKELRK